MFFDDLTIIEYKGIVSIITGFPQGKKYLGFDVEFILHQKCYLRNKRSNLTNLVMTYLEII